MQNLKHQTKALRKHAPKQQLTVDFKHLMRFMRKYPERNTKTCICFTKWSKWLQNTLFNYCCNQWKSRIHNI